MDISPKKIHRWPVRTRSLLAVAKRGMRVSETRHTHGVAAPGKQTRTAGEAVQPLGRLCADGGSVIWGGHWRNRVGVPEKIKNRIPTHPAIPRLGVCPKTLKRTRRDPCSATFTAAFFISATVWKSPQGPRTDG